MIANFIWKAMKTSAGTLPFNVPAIPFKRRWSNPPITPPWVLPKASEYPKSTHCTVTSASAKWLYIRVASTFLRRTIPP
jgi:hypothetical protein